MGFGLEAKAHWSTPGISLGCIPVKIYLGVFDHFHLISHNIGSTKIPVQPLSISKKREFDWVTRSKAPASMKNPFLSFDLKIT